MLCNINITKTVVRHRRIEPWYTICWIWLLIGPFFFSFHYINFSFTLILFVVSDQLRNFRRKSYQGNGIKEWLYSYACVLWPRKHYGNPPSWYTSSLAGYGQLGSTNIEARYLQWMVDNTLGPSFWSLGHSRVGPSPVLWCTKRLSRPSFEMEGSIACISSYGSPRKVFKKKKKSSIYFFDIVSSTNFMDTWLSHWQLSALIFQTGWHNEIRSSDWFLYPICSHDINAEICLRSPPRTPPQIEWSMQWNGGK